MKKETFTLLQHKRIPMIIVISSLLFVAMLFFYISNHSTSKAQAAIRSEISFKTVRISSHDTLWSIAKENYKTEYGSLQNYINEIKECNSLTSDNITAGCSIIVPVYVSDL